jgi:hypothetical protein
MAERSEAKSAKQSVISQNFLGEALLRAFSLASLSEFATVAFDERISI